MVDGDGRAAVPTGQARWTRRAAAEATGWSSGLDRRAHGLVIERGGLPMAAILRSNDGDSDGAKTEPSRDHDGCMTGALLVRSGAITEEGRRGGGGEGGWKKGGIEGWKDGGTGGDGLALEEVERLGVGGGEGNGT